MEKIDAIALNDFLNSKPRDEKVAAIGMISRGCMVPRDTVHNWRRGLCKIPELYKCKIEEIFEQKIFSTFPN